MTLDDVLKASRAESTASKYEKAFAAWKVWCKGERLIDCPAKQQDIARYFIFMLNSVAPYSRIEAAFYGIKWNMIAHQQCCLTHVTLNLFN